MIAHDRTLNELIFNLFKQNTAQIYNLVGTHQSSFCNAKMILAGGNVANIGGPRIVSAIETL